MTPVPFALVAPEEEPTPAFRPITAADRRLIAEHVAQLRELSRTHLRFASEVDERSDCRLTKAGAVAAGRRAARLAELIETVGAR